MFAIDCLDSDGGLFVLFVLKVLEPKGMLLGSSNSTGQHKTLSGPPKEAQKAPTVQSFTSKKAGPRKL